jgi:homoserine O-acetyltransferase
MMPATLSVLDFDARSGRTPTEEQTSGPARTPTEEAARRGEIVVTLGLRHSGPHLVRLRWETLGDPLLPCIVVLGGISADRHVAASEEFPEPGWWDAQVGAGRPIDPSLHHVVAIDWVGADGSVDLPLDTSDQADAVITVLDHLGITGLAAFVGCSYGGLVGLQLAIRYRRRLGSLIVISGASRAHPYAAAYRTLQRQVVALGLASDQGPAALALARQLGMLSYRTPAEFGVRFPEPTELHGNQARCSSQGYLEARGATYAAAWTPVAFLRLSESIDLHAIDPGAVRVPTTLAAVEGDWLVPPADVARLADGVRAPATFHLIISSYGHDAFLKETEQVATVLRQGLAGVTS